MLDADKLWVTLSRSRFPWEQEALDFVFERFPAQDNYRAWANFEFIADDGSINEVDLLVACPQGVFLIEIKSNPGTLRGDTLSSVSRRRAVQGRRKRCPAALNFDAFNDSFLHFVAPVPMPRPL